MFNLTPESKVGLFVLAGVTILVYMSLKVGGFSIGKEEGYQIYVSMDSAAGLDPNASVRVAGVEVGRAKVIDLVDNKARLTLLIKPGIVIGKDFTAVLKTQGLLGERYLDLLPGSPYATPLEDGDELTRVTTYTDIDKLLTILSDAGEDLKKVTRTLSLVLGDEEGETTLRNILDNIEEITFKVKRVVDRNDERLSNILANLEDFSGRLRDDMPTITATVTGAGDDLARMVDDIESVTGNLNALIEENREGLRGGIENLKTASVKLTDTLDSIKRFTEELGPRLNSTVTAIGNIAEKIDKGEGTLGKLVNDPSTQAKINDTLDDMSETLGGVNDYLEKTKAFRTYLGYRGEYLFEPGETKNYISLKIQPKADKYYLFELVDDPLGHRSTRTIEDSLAGTTQTIIETEDELKFTVLVAKRFGDLTLKGGIIESTGGAGIDYLLLNDRLELSFETFDFDLDRNPHIKTGATFHFNKYFFATAGYDDAISKDDLESPYFGLGFHFEDEDLKYLLSGAPPISF